MSETEVKEELYIASVFRFPNDMIAVCDQYGKQMPDYQRPFGEIQIKLEQSKLLGKGKSVNQKYTGV